MDKTYYEKPPFGFAPFAKGYDNWEASVDEIDWDGVHVSFRSKDGRELLSVCGKHFFYEKKNEDGTWRNVDPEELCGIWGVPRSGIEYKDGDEYDEKFSDYKGVSEDEVWMGYERNCYNVDPYFIMAILLKIKPTEVGRQ